MKTYKEIKQLRKEYTESSSLKISDRLTLYIDLDEPQYNLTLEDDRGRSVYLTLSEGARLFEVLSLLEIPEEEV